MNKTRQKFIVLGVCVICIALGGFGLFQILSGQPEASSISIYQPLGLLMSTFVFLESLGSGSLVASVLEKREKESTKLALFGLAAMACSGLVVILDLGKPIDSWRLWFAPNLESPILLDVWFMTFALIFGAARVVALKKGWSGFRKVTDIGTIVFAIILPLATSMIFCSTEGRIGYNTTMTMAVFLVQVAIGGALATLLLTSNFNETGILSQKGLRTLAAALLAFNALLVIGELLLASHRGSFESLSLKTIAFGSYAPVFWIDLILGIMVPACLLATNKGTKIAAGIGLVGMFLSKFIFVVRGNAITQYAALLGDGYYVPVVGDTLDGSWLLNASFPTSNEIMICIATFALVIFTTLVLMTIVRPKSLDSSSKTAE